jgi:hypothetical protein
MRSRRGFTLKALALLLTAAALLASSGCTRPSRVQEFADEPRAGEATSSASASGTPQSAGEAVGADGGSGSSGSDASSSSKMSTKDASALDAELSAIQSELDRLALPGDGDFDSIGSGLQ